MITYYRKEVPGFFAVGQRDVARAPEDVASPPRAPRALSQHLRVTSQLDRDATSCNHATEKQR